MPDDSCLELKPGFIVRVFFMIKIEAAHIDALTAEELNRLYEIIIIAYRETEVEVWGENYVRIQKADFVKHVEQGEVLLARNENNDVVGGVRYFQLKDKSWSFSLLGADFNEKGKGIGRALITAVEDKVKAAGGSEIRIEILRAKSIDAAFKKVISDWYQRLGYTYIKAVDVFDVYNDAKKWEKLVNPSVFDCYLKVLN